MNTEHLSPKECLGNCMELLHKNMVATDECLRRCYELQELLTALVGPDKDVDTLMEETLYQFHGVFEHTDRLIHCLPSKVWIETPTRTGL